MLDKKFIYVGIDLHKEQHTAKGLQRNPSFYAYYQKQLARGKSKPQALILISRRLINIIYGMLKNKTVYQMPE